VTPGSAKRVWWNCDQGPDHEWATSVANRALKGSGCPFSSGRRASGTNSLAALDPQLAAQWHPSRNGDLTPSDVPLRSSRKVWWRCPEGPDHEWEANLPNRAKRGDGCPFCRGIRASVTNSLVTRYPELAAQWHPSKNGDVTPDHVPAGSGSRYWWKCREGRDHQWKAQVYSRTQDGAGCPFCAGLEPSITHCLATTHPRVARLWHPDKNGELTPKQLTPGSNQVVWWSCPAGPDHVWEASIKLTVKSGGRCPFCAGRRVSVTNCLATLFPKVAREWHPKKNGELTPRQVLAASRDQARWRCARGHEWTDTIRNRTLGNQGCPRCQGS